LDSTTEPAQRMHIPLKHRNCGLFAAVIALCAISLGACSSPPVDPRSAVPADALIYFETVDLGRLMAAITADPAFQQAAGGRPDISLLNGIKLSAAVTGFEANEVPAEGETATLSFRPRFVAVAETNLWDYQARSFAEHKLGEYVNEVYGGEVQMDSEDRYGGRFFAWTAQDGRRAYALVRGSLVLFSNDQTAVERCVEALEGRTENMAGARKAASVPDAIAGGYASPEGVAQLASLASVTAAMQATEEPETRSFIAEVLPQMIRGVVREIAWTAEISDGLIKDSYDITFHPDAAHAAADALRAGPEEDLVAYIPEDVDSATRYSLADPLRAWQTILRAAEGSPPGIDKRVFPLLGASLVEPFGIERPEQFLSSISGMFVVVRFGGDSEALVVRARDMEALRRSLAGELAGRRTPEMMGTAAIWRTTDKAHAAAVENDVMIVGDNSAVERCLAARQRGGKIRPFFGALPPNTVAATVTNDPGPAAALAEVFGASPAAVSSRPSFTYTSFDGSGMKRTTISSFGLAGTLIAFFGKEG
jgi:hypothetical protein